ncbi:MAG: metal-sulfur cluster assembly factor [Bacteroidetes bacterium]|nr:metal-sulfur cluster assembly factor [Bacteroidota bacterium]MBS1633780.1 metal-sulfur cluster assembly factor [Bacteroidota bacterium]
MNVVTNDNIRSTIALAALHEVIDPEIGLNVVDLGLIYQLDFDEAAKKVFCTMTLTTQFCPMGESITDAAREALQTSFPDNEVSIQLTFEPPWRPDNISEEGRQFLNM